MKPLEITIDEIGSLETCGRAIAWFQGNREALDAKMLEWELDAWNFNADTIRTDSLREAQHEICLDWFGMKFVADWEEIFWSEEHNAIHPDALNWFAPMALNMRDAYRAWYKWADVENQERMDDYYHSVF